MPAPIPRRRNLPLLCCLVKPMIHAYTGKQELPPTGTNWGYEDLKGVAVCRGVDIGINENPVEAFCF